MSTDIRSALKNLIDAVQERGGCGIESAVIGDALFAVHNFPSKDDVQWIVNDIAELGVMILGKAFFLYKGGSLVYESATHDNGYTMHYRPVFKREFGECRHPVNYDNPKLIGTVSLEDSDEWLPLPAGVGA